MKIIRKVSEEEMRKKFPGTMAALDANPKDVFYCNICDGLRIKKHQCIDWTTGKPPTEERKKSVLAWEKGLREKYGKGLK